MFEPSKKCKSVHNPPSVDLRLKLEISELLAEVNDFLWQYYGRPQYVIRKLQFCPWTILKEDQEQMRALIDRVPNVDQLAKCRQLALAQSSQENKPRVAELERGIENVKKVKEILAELVIRVQGQLSSTGNISPHLNSIKSINAVKFATVGATGKPKSSTWQVREMKPSAHEIESKLAASSHAKPRDLDGQKLVIKPKIEPIKRDTFGKTISTVVQPDKQTELSKMIPKTAQRAPANTSKPK